MDTQEITRLASSIVGRGPKNSGVCTLYSIGHRRHPFAYFLELLQAYEIEFVCDVRAFARSRWPQFNGLVLAELLREDRIGYEHIPKTGGGNISLRSRFSKTPVYCKNWGD